jgi:hypothetical protein
MQLLAQALAYAAAGIPIFPCHYPIIDGGTVRCSCGKPKCVEKGDVGKHPSTPHGFHDATTDRDRIARYWSRVPEANIGIATGEVSGIDVVDVDPRHGGDRTLEALEIKYGGMPATLRARSGSGGDHIYFAHVPGAGSGNGKLGTGIDYKADRGYVIAPPSLHPSGGQYIWINEVPVSEPPEWLAAAVAAPKRATAAPPETYRVMFAASAAEGERRDRVTRLAGHFLARRLDPLLVLDILRLWNAARCVPPWDDKELVKTIDSLCGAEVKKLR